MRQVGIIGCGGISGVHAWALSNTKGVRLAALADPVRERALRVSHEYANGQAAIFKDGEELIKQTLDAVHICTPHYLHVPQTIAALQSGKAVFVEKPAAITREQLAALKQADREHPGKLSFCLQNRYNPPVQFLKRFVKDASLGRVTGGRAFVTWRRDEGYYEGNPWKGRIETEGGGVLVNQSIHTLDLLLLFLGKPVRVEATASNHHLQGLIEVEDTLEAWMEFEGGARGCFYATNAYSEDAPVILEISFEKGRVTLTGDMALVWHDGQVAQHTFDPIPGMGKSYWGGGHLEAIRNFYQALENDEPVPLGLQEVEDTFETMLTIYERVRG